MLRSRATSRASLRTTFALPPPLSLALFSFLHLYFFFSTLLSRYLLCPKLWSTFTALASALCSSFLFCILESIIFRLLSLSPNFASCSSFLGPYLDPASSTLLAPLALALFLLRSPILILLSLLLCILRTRESYPTPCFPVSPDIYYLAASSLLSSERSFAVVRSLALFSLLLPCLP